MYPSIDILMATHNGEKYLVEQIESIRYQAFQNWRLLVSDDCSTDGTLSIVERYTTLDQRIQVVSSGVRYGSAKANFLSLLKQAEADYVMFSDQDDVWFEDKIERTLAAMRELESDRGKGVPLLVFSDMVVVDERLEMISPSFERYSHIASSRIQFNQLLAQSVGAGCTMMVNRKLIMELSRAADASNELVMHDWFACIVAAAFGGISHVNGPTMLYRQHANNSVGAIEFHIRRFILEADEIVKSTRRSVSQAECVAALFASELSYRQRYSVEKYAAINYAGPFCAVCDQLKSGVWKSGLRAAGQMIGAMWLGVENLSMKSACDLSGK